MNWKTLENINNHIYNIEKKLKLKKKDSLIEILNDLKEKKESLMNSMNYDELNELYNEALKEEKIISHSLFFHMVLENPDISDVKWKSLFEIFRRIQFFLLQENTCVNYKDIEDIFNPYFNEIKTSWKELYYLESLINQNYKEKKSSYYLDEIKTDEIQEFNNKLLIEVLKDVGSVVIDLLETDSPDREEYLKTIFKVLPKSYHENIALQIKEIYDSSPKEKPNEFLESIISSYSLELEESTIEEDDIPYATFTKEQILNYELNYQKLLKLEKELFQTFKWLVENKLAGIKEPKLYELYSLLTKEEQEIFQQIPDFLNFKEYVCICYGNEKEYPIPYPMLRYVNSLENQKTWKELNEINEFFELRILNRINAYEITDLLIKERDEEERSNIILEEEVDIEIDQLLEDVSNILDYLIGNISEDTFKTIYNDLVTDDEEKENILDRFLIKYIDELEESISKIQDPEQKKFFLKYYYYLIFLEGNLVDSILKNQLDLCVEAQNLKVVSNSFYNEYKNMMEEIIEELNNYETENEKIIYNVFVQTYYDTLDEKDKRKFKSNNLKRLKKKMI